MSEERRKILNMVAEGRLTPEEADRLLNALSDAHGKKRFFKVRVYEKNNREKPTVKMDIPVSVLRIASRIGAAFKGIIPEGMKVSMQDKQIALDEFTPEMIDSIIESLGDEEKFTLAEVTDEEKGEYVEVYIE
ncbi:MAG: hypothetical protein JSW49_01540 [candidate division WOR-3 bacterium]|nr:MAG: hypothetical protein JSW49_01540 [candidate division WOR-3 bacterium]